MEQKTKPAEEIVSDVQAAADPETLQKDLRYLIDDYLLSTNDSPEGRDLVYSTFITLTEALEDMKPYNKRKNQKP